MKNRNNRLTLNQFIQLLNLSQEKSSLDTTISILKNIDVLPEKYEQIAQSFLDLLNHKGITNREFIKNSLPVKVISLKSSRRREIVTKFFTDINLNIEFVDAIDGVDNNFDPTEHQDYHLDHPISGKNSDRYDACSLSHAKVWRQVSEQSSSHSDYTLVCEDDVVPLPYFSDILPVVLSNAVNLSNQKPDIIFINNRASHWLGCEKPEILLQKFPSHLIPMDFMNEVIQKGVSSGMRGRGPNCRLFGAEGYLLSGLGAKKLVDFILNHGVVGGDSHIEGFFRHEVLIHQFLVRKKENIRCEIPDKVKTSRYIGYEPYLYGYISFYPLCSNLSEMGIESFSHIRTSKY